MRWKRKNKVKKVIEDGTIIKFEKFLLIPKCIDNEWIWLEKIIVEKTYVDRAKNFNRLNPKYAICYGYWRYDYQIKC